MKHQRGPRAATIRKLIDGSIQTQVRPHQTKIIVMPELLEMAEQYKICAPSGRGGLRPLRVYLEDCIIRDIREIEKRKEDLRKKL